MVGRMATFRLTGINNLVTYCAVLGVDPTALCKLGEHSNNEQHPQALLFGVLRQGCTLQSRWAWNTITSTGL